MLRGWMLLLSVSLLLCGCRSEQVVQPPDRVLEQYFDAMRTGDQDALLGFLTEQRRKLELEAIERFRARPALEVLSIQEANPTRISSETYTKQGYKDVRFFSVHWVDQEESVQWTYVIVRERTDGPWRIADWGH